MDECAQRPLRIKLMDSIIGFNTTPNITYKTLAIGSFNENSTVQYNSSRSSSAAALMLKCLHPYKTNSVQQELLPILYIVLRC